MLHWLHWLRNEMDFQIRNRIALRRGPLPLPGEEKDGLFPAEALPEVERLVATYGLERWQARSGRRDFAASLFYLQMLERALTEASVSLPDPLRVLDAGPGTWFYAPVLHGLLTRYGTRNPRQVALDGVELDAFALHAGFRSTHDLADAYIQGIDGVRYLPGDVRAYRQPVHLAVLLYPFLFATDLRGWGLPRRYLRPAETLGHAATLVEPGGWLLIANQGEEERREQHRLLAEAGLTVRCWFVHESALFRYRPERYVTVVETERGGPRA